MKRGSGENLHRELEDLLLFGRTVGRGETLLAGRELLAVGRLGRLEGSEPELHKGEDPLDAVVLALPWRRADDDECADAGVEEEEPANDVVLDRVVVGVAARVLAHEQRRRQRVLLGVVSRASRRL